MQTSRRDFLKKSAAASAAAAFQNFEKLAAATLPPPSFVARKLPVKILATDWGWAGTLEDFCKKVKAAGFDGFETWVPREPSKLAELLAAVQKFELEIGLLAGGYSQNFEEHKIAYQTGVELAAAQRPLYVNTHAGRDYFSLEQNLELLRFGIEISKKTGVPVLCETHRGRCAFSAPATLQLLDALPDLRLTADLSHWCCVHESLLGGFDEVLDLALQRADHVHARVGHEQGPQVGDPRAPEWAAAVERHFSWWDRIVENRMAAGAQHLTFLTEFGPPNYLPALPYTRQPVVNQWDVNVFMMKTLRERYG